RFPGAIPELGADCSRVTHPFAARVPRRAFPLDLHVLSTPPAFVLSQDQTLQQKPVENMSWQSKIAKITPTGVHQTNLALAFKQSTLLSSQTTNTHHQPTPVRGPTNGATPHASEELRANKTPSGPSASPFTVPSATRPTLVRSRREEQTVRSDRLRVQLPSSGSLPRDETTPPRSNRQHTDATNRPLWIALHRYRGRRVDRLSTVDRRRADLSDRGHYRAPS